MEPRIQYAQTSDGVSIAFRSMGRGAPLVYVGGAPFNHAQLESRIFSYKMWHDLMTERWNVIALDPRGCGMSDRQVSDLSVEAQELDIAAVADKLGLDSFALFGGNASGLAAIKYTIENRSRVSHLVLIDAFPDGTEFAALPQTNAFLTMLQADWPMFTETVAHAWFNWTGGDATREMANFFRECVEQSTAIEFYRRIQEASVKERLPEVSVPTLVMHHNKVPIPPVDTARLLASRIPDARLTLLDGTWGDPGDDLERFVGAMEDLLDTGAAAGTTYARGESSGGLATILFTDIEGSTALTQRLGDVRARELLRAHERLVREQLKAHGGAEVKTMGDGFMASFSSATRALECAIAIQRAVEGEAAADAPPDDETIRVRIGLNAGEPIAEEADLFGTAVIAAARIAAKARGGEVLASDVVRQLVAGRGFLFADRGEAELRGFDDPVRLYEVRWREEA